MDNNLTYDKTSAKEVWVARGMSGLEKRQCNVQLTVFADGSTLPPLLSSEVKAFALRPTKEIDGIRESKSFFKRKRGVTKVS